jgi:hypothetical protein
MLVTLIATATATTATTRQQSGAGCAERLERRRQIMRDSPVESRKSRVTTFTRPAVFFQPPVHVLRDADVELRTCRVKIMQMVVARTFCVSY